MSYQDAINAHFRKCMAAGSKRMTASDWAEMYREKDGEVSILRKLLREARDDIYNWQQAYCLAGPSKELLARIDAVLSDAMRHE